MLSECCHNLLSYCRTRAQVQASLCESGETNAGVSNAVVPPKVSQRRAQPCAAVLRRIDTASSRAMSLSMRCLALGDRTRALAVEVFLVISKSRP